MSTTESQRSLRRFSHDPSFRGEHVGDDRPLRQATTAPANHELIKNARRSDRWCADNDERGAVNGFGDRPRNVIDRARFERRARAGRTRRPGGDLDAGRVKWAHPRWILTKRLRDGTADQSEAEKCDAHDALSGGPRSRRARESLYESRLQSFQDPLTRSAHARCHLAA